MSPSAVGEKDGSDHLEQAHSSSNSVEMNDLKAAKTIDTVHNDEAMKVLQAYTGETDVDATGGEAGAAHHRLAVDAMSLHDLLPAVLRQGHVSAPSPCL
jgi:hypothetical protein